MKEIWKDIPEFEGLYRISNTGKVMTLHNNRNRLLTLKINNTGYAWVELSKNGKRKQFLVHRLVAMGFLDNPNNYPVINHKDENRLNNSVDNLEWCTLSYNTKYSIKLHPDRLHRNGKLMKIKINQYSLDGEFVRTWDNSRTIFKETGMSDYSISQCCLGIRNKAYGYKWQYAIDNSGRESAL